MRPRVAMRFAGTLFAATLVASVLAGCTSQSADEVGPGESVRSRNATPIAQLQKVEVRQYQGKRLDSIAALQENSIKGPQYVDLKTYRLRVSGTGIPKPVSYTYDQVVALPAYQKNVTLNCVEGWSADLLWQGAKLSDLFAKAGYDATGTPPGKRPTVVIFRCADGYSTSLPFDYINSRQILLAYKENGVDLPAMFGFPFQVVAEDRWGYKWAKWITAIELSTDTSFRGYWEKRGYSNDASLTN
jgi:DMSO/TMAO reductase YedYZ molybdopterin-dependent catalytic subunit